MSSRSDDLLENRCGTVCVTAEMESWSLETPWFQVGRSRAVNTTVIEVERLRKPRFSDTSVSECPEKSERSEEGLPRG